jgi:hypothetical protein
MRTGQGRLIAARAKPLIGESGELSCIKAGERCGQLLAHRREGLASGRSQIVAERDASVSVACCGIPNVHASPFRISNRLDAKPDRVRAEWKSFCQDAWLSGGARSNDERNKASGAPSSHSFLSATTG